MPAGKRGACLWFTGLSGSGKSTTAAIVVKRLEERGRTVTVLDGDVVRTHLSAGLGFSRQDRDINVRRIGYVAAEVVRHGGIAVAAVVSPYRETRDEVRRMVGPESFVEVFVDTPVEVCEARDVKGWYAKARSGEISGLTGVDDPYEPPLHPELTLHTVDTTPERNADVVMRELEDRGFLERPRDDRAGDLRARFPDGVVHGIANGMQLGRRPAPGQRPARPRAPPRDPCRRGCRWHRQFGRQWWRPPRSWRAGGALIATEGGGWPAVRPSWPR